MKYLLDGRRGGRGLSKLNIRLSNIISLYISEFIAVIRLCPHFSSPPFLFPLLFFVLTPFGTPAGKVKTA